MSDRRALRYDTLDAITDDVRQLRAGYERTGQWTLAQACWHLNVPLDHCLQTPPSTITPTESERHMQRLLNDMLATGVMPAGLPIAPGTEPPADAGDDAIDGFLAGLETLRSYPHAHVGFGPFGPVATPTFHGFIRLHAALHLSFLIPKSAGPTRRAGLTFENFEAVQRDIATLQRGYFRAGNWSLEQVCYHLDQTMATAMRPGPHAPNTPEQDGRRELFAHVMRTGEIPSGLATPAFADPPVDAPASAIDAYFVTIDRFLKYKGEYAPHRLFGNLPPDVRRQHQLFHAAHHLSYLIPTSAN